MKFKTLLFILAAIVITAEIRLAPTIKSIASQKAKNAAGVLYVLRYTNIIFLLEVFPKLSYIRLRRKPDIY